MLETLARTRDARLIGNPARHELKSWLAGGHCSMWLDLVAPTQAELALVFQDIFPIHPLAFEDVCHYEAAPKVDSYGEYVVVVFHSVQGQEAPMSLDTVEHTAVIGRNILITVTFADRHFFAQYRQHTRHHEDGLALGPALLFYHLINQQAVVSRRHIEAFSDMLESLGDIIFTENLSTASQHQIMEDILTAKSTALRLHRVLAPQADVLARLGRDHYPVIPPEARIFFRDTQDLALHLVALTSSLRELATSTMTTHLTLANHRLNEVMKILTMIATIFIPLTFVTSIYGMNFRHMPEIHWVWSYPVLLIFCAVAVAIMLFLFKRKKWL